MNKRKKVKFWDHESTRTQRIRSPVAGDAKTSEYKSFQKLLGKSHANQPPRYDNDSRNLDANDCTLKRNDPAPAKFHGKRSISPALVVTPIALRPSSSTNTISQESDLKDDVRCKHTSSIQSTIHKCIFDPWGSSFSPGPEKKYEGIFSSKRENLLKLAAGTLTLKADDITSNKSNLIHECMQRLSSGQKSANPDEISKPRKKASCGRSHSYASMRSHNKDKETQDLRRKREISLLDQHCNRDDELFSPVPKSQFISHFNAGESEFCTNHNTRHHIPLKAPTLQSIECNSDSMLDEEHYYKSSSNRYLHNFRYKRKLEEQQIIPYSNSNISYNFYDHDISPKFPKEQGYDFPLQECSYYTNAKPEDSEELDSLPLALYNDDDDGNALDQIENTEPIHFFGEEDMFRPSPIGYCSEYEFDDEESDYRSSWCTTRNKYDDFMNRNEVIDFSSCYNFSMDRETSFLDFEV